MPATQAGHKVCHSHTTQRSSHWCHHRPWLCHIGHHFWPFSPFQNSSWVRANPCHRKCSNFPIGQRWRELGFIHATFQKSRRGAGPEGQKSRAWPGACCSHPKHLYSGQSYLQCSSDPHGSPSTIMLHTPRFVPRGWSSDHSPLAIRSARRRSMAFCDRVRLCDRGRDRERSRD